MSDRHPAVPETGEPTRRSGPRWVRACMWIAFLILLAVGVSLAFDTPVVATAAAVLLGVVILRAGWFFLQSFATPPPPPPEAGTIRKVKLVYRCSVCGAEVRMTAAPTEDPEPPRHCMDDMDLVSPID